MTSPLVGLVEAGLKKCPEPAVNPAVMGHGEPVLLLNTPPELLWSSSGAAHLAPNAQQCPYGTLRTRPLGPRLYGLLLLLSCEAPVAGDHLASWARCDARSLVETLLLGTSAECGQNVMELVTPEYSTPETALTVLPLNLSDLSLQLPAPPQTNLLLSAV